MWTFEVNSLTVGFEDIGGDVAGDVEHTLVVLDGIVEVYGCILILVFVCEVAFLELNDAFHFRVIEIEIKFRMVAIIISHDVLYFEFCL